jgi:integrase/recombinase XerD
MSKPGTVLSLAEAYLSDRRALGFKAQSNGSQIKSFARFADDVGHTGPLTSRIVLLWAKDEAHRASPFTWGQRVNVLRPFARYLADIEPGTEFPRGAPFGRSRRRLAPHIYTQEEIDALLSATRRLSPLHGLRPATYETLFGLLVATGIRISEALHLQCRDFDPVQGKLLVRWGKFQRIRALPLHPTVTTVLERYLRRRARDGQTNDDAPFFLSSRTGKQLRYRAVSNLFRKLCVDIGIKNRGGHPAVRIHDLRHTFICRRVMLWHESGVDIDNAMMALSTYVGHVNLTDTYWYLHAIPNLMAVAAGRFETFAGQREEARHG